MLVRQGNRVTPAQLAARVLANSSETGYPSQVNISRAPHSRERGSLKGGNEPPVRTDKVVRCRFHGHTEMAVCQVQGLWIEPFRPRTSREYRSNRRFCLIFTHSTLHPSWRQTRSPGTFMDFLMVLSAT